MKIILDKKENSDKYYKLYKEFIGKKGISIFDFLTSKNMEYTFIFCNKEELYIDDFSIYENYIEFVIEIDKHGRYSDITIINIHDIEKLKLKNK